VHFNFLTVHSARAVAPTFRYRPCHIAPIITPRALAIEVQGPEARTPGTVRGEHQTELRSNTRGRRGRRGRRCFILSPRLGARDEPRTSTHTLLIWPDIRRWAILDRLVLRALILTCCRRPLLSHLYYLSRATSRPPHATASEQTQPRAVKRRPEPSSADRYSASEADHGTSENPRPREGAHLFGKSAQPVPSPQTVAWTSTAASIF
jgi:hypothetical protein